MNRLQSAVTFALSLLLVLSCGSNMPFDPMDPRLDEARVVIVGSSAINLRFGQSADLRVRYEFTDGTVIANAPIDFSIEGDGAGSRLSALQTVTDGGGEAFVQITAGTVNGTYNVSATPQRGAAANFQVAVSDQDVGSIVVNLSYSGMRDLGRIDAFLYDGETCDGIDPARLPTALRSAPPVSNIRNAPAFAGVPVGSAYAVGVTARNGTRLAAFGCRDRIGVQTGQETIVNITLTDLDFPPSFVGTWDLDNRLDLGGALPPSVDNFLNILDEMTDDNVLEGEQFEDVDGDGHDDWGVDPGAFVTDLVARQTCAWECNDGESYDTCSQDNHRFGDLRAMYVENFTSWNPEPGNPGARPRFTGGCGAWSALRGEAQDTINELIAENLPSFVTDWANLAGDLSRAVTQAHVLSILTINAPQAGDEFLLPMEHQLLQLVVDLRDPTSTPPGMMRTFNINLADAGARSLTVSDQTMVDGTTLTIPQHQFELNWGQLILYIYRNIFLQEVFGVMSTGDLLATWLDCDAIGTRVVEAACNCDTDIPDDCNGCIVSESTASGYCMTGLRAAGALLEATLAGFLDADGTLTLGGTTTGADISDETGQVGRLENGVWSGTFGEDGMTGDVTGTFTGARR